MGVSLAGFRRYAGFNQEIMVIPISELPGGSLSALLTPLGLRLRQVEDDAAIEGSYWGEPEAGLIGDELVIRGDTPVHSALHEACHWLCMEAARRRSLHTDAGGSDTEENAVCYLQVLLADRLAGYSRQQMFEDMDAWGYNFRLGSAQAWFQRDADDAVAWLLSRKLLGDEAASALAVAQVGDSGAALSVRVIGPAE